MRYATLILLAAMPCLAVAGSIADKKAIRANCRVQWTDHYWRNVCERLQQQDRIAFRRLADDYRRSSDKGKIMTFCRRNSPGVVRGTDFVDALNCATYYLKEYRRNGSVPQ